MGAGSPEKSGGVKNKIEATKVIEKRVHTTSRSVIEQSSTTAKKSKRLSS